ncbi:MAG: hypothetical protein ABI467_04645 [Kofleriaceae bacterium]
MKSALVVLALAGVAHAGDAEVTRTQTTAPLPPAPAKPDAPPAPASSPDPAAEQAASEANLESNAPRAGVTFSVAVGAGLTMGDGVGRGPAASLRVGHVATPSTVLTFEITGGSLLHQDLGSTKVHHNDDFSLMAGALHYVNHSLWVRGAGGLTVYTTDNTPPELHSAHAGIGGLVGVGIDFVRWHYLVLGLETFGQLSIVSTKGLLLNNGLCLGLSYY